MSTGERQHTLYRFYNDRGELLYVGRTVSARRRWREHEKTAAWFDDVSWVTREVLPSAEAVDVAEREAISNEGPLHNIALNGRVSRPSPVRRPVVIPGGDDAATHAVRRNAMADLFGDEPVTQCLGDETICECPTCHAKRLCEFEELRAKYSWHPVVDGQITAVERSYYAGHDLVDWYYGLFDIDLFAPLQLVTESEARPLPAFAEILGTIAAVECPFCFGTHRHLLAVGDALETPLRSACANAPRGRYFLLNDWGDLSDELYRWGEFFEKGAVA